MKCDYCGEEVSKTKGKMLVLNSGKKIMFCSGKCEKNFKKNRKLNYAEKEK